MATYRKRGDRWHVGVRMRGISKCKSFDTKAAGQVWAANLEIEIRKKYELDQLRPYKIPAGLISERDIVSSSVPAEAMSGVYFLIQDSRVVYVGKSVDMYTRVSEHKSKGREFTHFSVIQCPPEGLNELESKYILAFNPIGNTGRYGKLVYSVSAKTIQGYIDEVNKPAGASLINHTQSF